MFEIDYCNFPKFYERLYDFSSFFLFCVETYEREKPKRHDESRSINISICFELSSVSMRLFFVNEIEKRETRGRSIRVTIPRPTILKLFDTMLLGNTESPPWHGVSIASSCKHVHVHEENPRRQEGVARPGARAGCTRTVYNGAKGEPTPWGEPVTDRQSSQYLYIVASRMILFSTVQLRFKAAPNGKAYRKSLK